MKTIEEIHRENLAILVAEAGGPTKYGELVSKSPAQISQWMTGSKDSKTGKARGISADICRLFEEKSGRPHAWMDHEHLTPDSYDEDKLLAAYRATHDDLKAHSLRSVENNAIVYPKDSGQASKQVEHAPDELLKRQKR